MIASFLLLERSEDQGELPYDEYFMFWRGLTDDPMRQTGAYLKQLILDLMAVLKKEKQPREFFEFKAMDLTLVSNELFGVVWKEAGECVGVGWGMGGRAGGGVWRLNEFPSFCR